MRVFRPESLHLGKFRPITRRAYRGIPTGCPGERTQMQTVRFSELARLEPEEKSRRLGELVQATRLPVNGELATVDAALRGYEQRHGFDSETMRRRLTSGELSESTDVCEWLMLLNLRNRLASLASRSR